MAQKHSPDSLIHCAECGEDYSATYKRCPFCGAKNEPSRSDSTPADLDDTYVFDGQDLFDGEGDEDDVPAAPRGGKRLAGKPLSNPFANADINWPRVITFVCSLIIIVAALIIVFTVIYPQLQGSHPSDSTPSPSPSDTDPAGDNSQDPGPSAAVSDPAVTDPGTQPTDTMPPVVSSGLKGFTANNAAKDSTSTAKPEGFTLKAGESWQMRLAFDPVDWSGEVTYSVSDEKYATVSAGGNVTNVNQDSSLHTVYLTISAGGLTLEMPVYCRGASAAQPSASDAPASDAPASDAPSEPAGPTAITFKRATDADFTLTPNESYTITLNFSPADWSGTVTWTSSDPDIANVDANGKVTNVNTTGSLRSVVVTASAGGVSLKSTVRCRSGSTG